MENFKKEQLKRLIIFNVLTVFALIVTAVSALGIKFANSRLPDGFYIPYCLCHDLLHLYCPFCGCTRAGLALLRLDVAESFAANPLVILFCVGFAAYDVIAVARVNKGNALPDLRRLGFWVGIFLLVFSLVRNILMIFFGFDTLGELSFFWQSVIGVH